MMERLICLALSDLSDIFRDGAIQAISTAPGIIMDRAVANLPAPVWFVQFFKWLGFTLHTVPMNLWFAGLLIALWLCFRGDENGRRFGSRLLKQMPIIVAFGINLGVVPLLFIQLAYYKFFYPATILMAWFWIGIIALLIPAYYGVYAYAWQMGNGRENGPKGPPAWAVAAGWCSACLFIAISFIFANGLSLMDNLGRWPELYQRNNFHGAALGTALNVGDATLWPRWLLMFGLALCTTAAWSLVDAYLFARKSAGDAYRQWAFGFAKKLYTVGMIWTAVAGTWYVFGTWSSDLRGEMFGWPMTPLTLATGMAAGLPWTLLMFGDRFLTRGLNVTAIVAGQFGVLGINALSRQVVQNVNLRPFENVYSQPTAVEWSPLLMFLVVFVIGLAVVGWMIAQVAKCGVKNCKQ
jgi:hypothetical protein